MKIECLRHREGGTKIELDDTTYHFAPQPDGRHVAEVTKTSHIKILLGIEAYAIVDPNVADMLEPKPRTTASAPVTQTAPEQTDGDDGEGADEDDEDGDEDEGNGDDTSTAETEAAPAQTVATVQLDDLSDTDLRRAYQLTLNKVPGGMKRPNLIAALTKAGYVHTAE